ncbi:hypothetical protein LB566_27220 [Mesorhizobium sp. CA13]|uniref:hypothetical protein n=1 Tax=unclassified Mesorhizobium TaxID=325217 RepID=UPI00112ADED7|nr:MULTISPECIES: hypothetical protein [unclassified Mesorhizobium]MBZ9857482.1 hypothetical protein [Mesorhizobium sp. CA13]MBZ9966687.1 hypothetical protein [Mesorhizobium sp. BR1-1-2]MCA0014851.1 hypothetical protein [Mesorhizobium sp. B294B1A1]MCA0041029.1 hypothetical protein [Mesorhizobium sp. B292B1B]TPM38033.1 hypothetical protein FJ964_29325 [Mesorhizobium sp. B2-3-2]
MPNASQKIAENVVLLAFARVSMALALPTIAMLFWLYSQWQDTRLDTMQGQIIEAQQSASEASSKATKVSDRLIAVETKQVQDAASSEKFQSATLTRFDRVQDSIVGLSNAVAVLTATLQGMLEERKGRAPP